jgi:hypothetical protein
VRFANVDDEERYLIAEAAMQGFEVPSLGAKRGSGKATKNEGDWLMVAKRREPYSLGTIESR